MGIGGFESTGTGLATTSFWKGLRGDFVGSVGVGADSMRVARREMRRRERIFGIMVGLGIC